MGSLKARIWATVLVCLLATSLFGVPAQTAEAAQVTHQTLIVRKDMSLPVPVSLPYHRIVVSEPEIAMAAPVSTQEYYVRGRQIGMTNVLVYDEGGKLIQIVDVMVMANLQAIEADLFALFPGEKVELHPVADRVHVRGEVSNQETIDRIMEVVDSHVPGLAINALNTPVPAQVLLEVRFVEASRDDVRELGFGADINQAGDFLFMTSSTLVSGTTPQAVGTLFGQSGSTTIDIFLEALEEKGVIRTLAKPNLVARSGQSASFLAGGEYPVPVSSEDGQIGIEFKEYGVSLAFTPTVVREDHIIMQVNPIVSGLDTRNSVRLSGTEIPALTTREIDTEVELGNGQSFAIAGLIQNDFEATEVQTPLLGDIPILGNLFRSTRFRNNETELVVIITPRLVTPMNRAEDLRDPVTESELPNPSERYVFNRVESEDRPAFGETTESNIKKQADAAKQKMVSGTGAE